VTATKPNGWSSSGMADEHKVHLPSSFWSNHSPGQTFPGVLSDFQHRLSGTCCHKQFSSEGRCLLSDRDFKFFYSLRLSLNIDLTGHHTSKVTTVWRYINMMIIIIIKPYGSSGLFSLLAL